MISQRALIEHRQPSRMADEFLDEKKFDAELEGLWLI
jgi:hypothetical protein